MNIIITPYYNCDKYLSKCINSLKQQTEKFHCYLIGDNSTDFSNIIAMEISKYDKRFTTILNTEKKYVCFNYKYVIDNFCNNDDTIFCLDGDDKFAHKDVIKYISNIYNDKNIWITYGSYINKSDNSLGLSREVPNIYTLRLEPWCTSHLRTFKAGLFKKIKTEDFLDWSNQPLQMSCDCAMMFPMIEMAGEKHSKFISEILYIYSDTNQISEHRVDLVKQLKCADWIRSKQPYEKL